MVAINLEKLPKRGEVHTYVHRNVRFEMKIVDARIRYGKVDVSLTPVNGSGELWVRYDNLLKNAEAPAEQAFDQDAAVARLEASMALGDQAA
jgi:hypothetical protein